MLGSRSFKGQGGAITTIITALSASSINDVPGTRYSLLHFVRKADRTKASSHEALILP
jgi:hypothetical protein